ncbi:MAG: hypothetical protein AAF682_03020 [Planctomycetota bacterium]
MTARFLTGLALIALGSPVVAQDLVDGLYSWFPYSNDVAAAGPPESMHVGRLTGDMIPDVVFLAAGRPYLAYGPSVYRTTIAIDGPTGMLSDVGVLPGGGFDCNDAFVSVSPEGLHLWRILPGTVSWDCTLVDGNEWAGATRLKVVDTDLDGSPNIVGLAADGHTLLDAEDEGAGWTTTTLYEAGVPIEHYELLDWASGEGLDGLELAVADAEGLLSVYPRGGGESIYSYTVGARSLDLAVIDRVDDPHQRVAWISLLGETHYLSVHGAGGDEGMLSLGILSCFELTAGDADLDGDSDLLISHRYSTDQVLLANFSDVLPGGATFSYAGVILVRVAAPGTDMSQQMSAGAAGDLDGDGDDDLFLPIVASQEYLLLLNWAKSETAQRVYPGGEDSLLETDPLEGDFNLTFSLKSPSPPPQANAVELTVWHQPEEAPYTLEWVGSYELPMVNGAPPEQTTVNIPILQTPNKDAFHLIMRMVYVEDGQVKEGFPVSISTFVADNAEAASLENEYQILKQDLDQFEGVAAGMTFKPTGVQVGGIVPRVDPNLFDPTQWPNPPASQS